VVGLDHPAIEAQVDRRPQCVFDLQHERAGTLEGRPPSGQWGSRWNPKIGQAAPMRSAPCPENFQQTRGRFGSFCPPRSTLNTRLSVFAQNL
jgi:hypothetical protein